MCVCVLAITFEENDLWPRYLTHFILTLHIDQVRRSKSYIRVHSHGTRNIPFPAMDARYKVTYFGPFLCAKVVSGTLSAGYLYSFTTRCIGLCNTSEFNCETCWNRISLRLSQPRRIVIVWLLRLRRSLTLLLVYSDEYRQQMHAVTRHKCTKRVVYSIYFDFGGFWKIWYLGRLRLLHGEALGIGMVDDVSLHPTICGLEECCRNFVSSSSWVQGGSLTETGFDAFWLWNMAFD